MPARPLDEDALFQAARRIEDAAARRSCSSRPGRRTRRRALAAAGKFGHCSARTSRRRIPRTHRGRRWDHAPIAERVGSKIGPYRLMEQIAEGGFGLVFVLAEQQEPVQRKVGNQDHQAGHGLAATHRPLLRRGRAAQARADGSSLTSRRCSTPPLTETRADVLRDGTGSRHPHHRLLRQAAAGAQGAARTLHLRLPGHPARAKAKFTRAFFTATSSRRTCLVTSHDGKPVAKVIDFGVAKAIHQQLSERTIYTQFAQMVGTPLYMSPEQAEMSGLDIDTRSDIYSLGVLLYELLTGTTPIDRKLFAKAAYDEIRRLIREEEPPKPSTRISTLPTERRHKEAVTPRRSFADRGSDDSSTWWCPQAGRREPAKLSEKLIRGDLDWITMKAARKKTERALRDRQRPGHPRPPAAFLDDEPVEASPPVRAYRLRRGNSRRKNRAALATAAAIAFLLVAGIMASACQAVRATRAETRCTTRPSGPKPSGPRRRSRPSRTPCRPRPRKLSGQGSGLRSRLAQIEKGTRSSPRIFADLDIRKVKEGTEPLEAVLARRLVKAAEQLEGDSVGDPLTVAKLQSRLGNSLLSLGCPNEAIGLCVKARQTFSALSGADHDDTVDSMNDLARALPGRRGSWNWGRCRSTRKR